MDIKKYFTLEKRNFIELKKILRTKRFFQFAFLAVILFSIFTLSFALRHNLVRLWFSKAANQTIDIRPIADTYVRADYPDRSYGTQANMRMDGSPVMVAFVKIDLSVLSGKTISSAKFIAKVSDSASGTRNVKETTSSWSETAINYKNKPALGTVTSSFPGGASGNWISVDLTSFVNKYKGGVASFAIDTADSNAFNLNTINSSYKPYLRVTYSDGQTVSQTSTPTPTKGISAQSAAPAITKKVVVLNFDPYISGTTPLSVSRGWNNVGTLQNQYIADIKSLSANYANYKIVETKTIRDYPVKEGGVKFTNDQYLACLNGSAATICNKFIDYDKLIKGYGLCDKAVAGTLDEVWLWGGPYFGYWEWGYAMPSNIFGIWRTGTCSKKLPIMGFSYERENDVMLHNFAHRSEGVMQNVYDFYIGDPINLNNPWSHFWAYDKVAPGKGGCGSVHYPANGRSDYDYTNTGSANSDCASWTGSIPATTGPYISTNCSAWGCNDYGYMKYWLGHLPHSIGATNGKLNNWWAYLIDYDNAVGNTTVLPTSGPTATPTTSVTKDKDTTGVFRPSNGALYLKNSNKTGYADIQINYGLAGDYPVVGDWDGNGTVTIGIYRNGTFYLRNNNTIGFADIVFSFGKAGDQPISGDWNNDGKDTIGIYRPSTGQFLLRNSNSSGSAHMSFYLGNVGDVGIAGDWNGDGIDTTGVFRPSNGVIYLKNKNETGYADIELNYGVAGDQPVTGDWNNDGIDTIGVYRNATFYLRNSNTIGFADMVFSLGNPGDMPIAGNWDGQP